jgi:hypothetical protein
MLLLIHGFVSCNNFFQNKGKGDSYSIQLYQYHIRRVTS